MFNLKSYKEKFHFSVNFYSVFLLITFIPDITGINSMVIRLSYWAIKVLLGLWVITKSKNVLVNFSKWENLVLIVYLIYGVNIFIDVFISPRPLFSAANGTMNFIGFAIIVLIVLAFRYDPAYDSKKSFMFFTVSLSIGLIMAYFLARQNLDLDTHHVRYDANSTVNSIGYGQSGCALALVSIFGFVNYKKQLSKLLFILAFLVGMLSIAKAGSRSPVVVLVGVITFYLMAKKGSVNGIILILTIATLVFLFIDPILELLASTGSELGARLTSMVVNKEGSGRTEIWQNTIDIISKSPIFGDYYMIPSGTGMGFYPHNFILEIFMGTGFIGGLPFIILIFYSLVKAYKLININHPTTWVIVLYLQMLVFGMFSTSLYSSQDFWALIFYVVSVKFTVKPITGRKINIPIPLED